MKREYRVDGYFSFRALANSPGELKGFISKVLAYEGIDEKNFEIDVSRVNAKGDIINEDDSEIKQVVKKDENTKEVKVRKTKIVRKKYAKRKKK